MITKEIIEYVLIRAYNCCNNDQFIISRNENREENEIFIKRYNLTKSRQVNMIKSLVYTDFCKSEGDIKTQDETVYIFGKIYDLMDIETGKEELVNTYIKFVFKQRKSGELMVVISFHKANKKIRYYFK